MKILKFLSVTLVVLAGITALMLYESDIPKDVVDARYTSPNSQFADLGELGLVHYRDEGHRRSLPVVLLHGSNASLHTFEPWVTLLSDDYRLITIDLPGHGLTGEVPSGDYSNEAMSKVVTEVTNLLGVDQFAIGGNSMGGRIAWQYALDHAEKILGLVLMNSGGVDRAVNDEDSQGVLAFRLLGKPWFRAVAGQMDPYHLVVQGVRAAYNNSPVINDALIMRYNDLALRAGTRRAMLGSFSEPWPESRLDELHELTAPTLLMWGKEDSVTPFAFATEFEARIKNLTTAYYDDVGHIPMEEIPEQSSRDLAAFLESLRSEPDES